jgi:hypothetical protein
VRIKVSIINQRKNRKSRERLETKVVSAERVKNDHENKDCQSNLRLLMKVQIEWRIGKSENSEVATGNELGFLQSVEWLHVLRSDWT